MVNGLLRGALVGFGVAALFGCTVSTGLPGVPDVEIVPSYSAIQTVCRDFGRDMGSVNSAEDLLDAILVAEAEAEAGAVDATRDDPSARSVVQSLQGVLSTTSKAAVESAMADVMAACTEVGVPMSWGE